MSEYISFGEAWKYCASFASYWIWIGAFVVGLLGGLVLIEQFGRKNNKEVGPVKLVWVIIFAFLIFGAIFKNPANVAQNTTVEQSKRGVFIGF